MSFSRRGKDINQCKERLECDKSSKRAMLLRNTLCHAWNIAELFYEDQRYRSPR